MPPPTLSRNCTLLSDIESCCGARYGYSTGINKDVLPVSSGQVLPPKGLKTTFGFGCFLFGNCREGINFCEPMHHAVEVRLSPELVETQYMGALPPSESSTVFINML